MHGSMGGGRKPSQSGSQPRGPGASRLPDQPPAKVSALACAALLLDEGVDPILQITGRDRNLMAGQATC